MFNSINRSRPISATEAQTIYKLRDYPLSKEGPTTPK